jgi:hypothetical protein
MGLRGVACRRQPVKARVAGATEANQSPESREEAGPIAERMSDVLSESRASSLVKGLKNPAQLGLPKQDPAPAPVFNCALCVLRG